MARNSDVSEVIARLKTLVGRLDPPLAKAVDEFGKKLESDLAKSKQLLTTPEAIKVPVLAFMEEMVTVAESDYDDWETETAATKEAAVRLYSALRVPLRYPALVADEPKPIAPTAAAGKKRNREKEYKAERDKTAAAKAAQVTAKPVPDEFKGTRLEKPIRDLKVPPAVAAKLRAAFTTGRAYHLSSYTSEGLQALNFTPGEVECVRKALKDIGGRLKGE